MRNKTFRASALASMTLWCIQSAFADTTPRLNPILVTADRMASTVDDTLASVSVITREDIERTQASSVIGVLRGLSGVTLSNSGGQGKQTALFLRGTNSDHVLVLIDGVKINSATSGAGALQNIPIDQVERIELVRGPRASLYGSEAIGGVIQIFTRKGSSAASGLTPSLSLGAGSRSTFNGAINLAGNYVENHRGAWFDTSLTAQSTRGFNACEANLYAGCYADEPDRDGYRDYSMSVRGGYKFSADLSAELQWLQTHLRNDYDGSYQNENTGRQQTLSTTVRYKPTQDWQSALQLGRSLDVEDDFLNGQARGHFRTERLAASWQNDLAVGENHTFNIGLDTEHDKVISEPAYDKTRRQSAAIFTQYKGVFDQKDIQLSFREDHNSQFGYYGTGAFAAGYTFSKSLRLMASYGTAFKAPTFNMLYYPGSSNPHLTPEKSQSYEVGLSGEHPWSGRWQVNAYQTDITDLIASDRNWIPANIAQAQIRGLESAIGWTMLGVELNANLTLLDPTNQSEGANNGKQLPRRSRQSARLDADRQWNNWSFGASWIAQGKRYDDIGNRQKLGGYATVDLRAEYRFSKAWRLQGRIENLLNKRYESVYRYNQAGFGVFATLRYEAQ